jgi:hypothetical protein
MLKNNGLGEYVDDRGCAGPVRFHAHLFEIGQFPAERVRFGNKIRAFIPARKFHAS